MKRCVVFDMIINFFHFLFKTSKRIFIYLALLILWRFDLIHYCRVFISSQNIWTFFRNEIPSQNQENKNQKRTTSPSQRMCLTLHIKSVGRFHTGLRIQANHAGLLIQVQRTFRYHFSFFSNPVKWIFSILWSGYFQSCEVGSYCFWFIAKSELVKNSFLHFLLSWRWEFCSRVLLLCVKRFSAFSSCSSSGDSRTGEVCTVCIIKRSWYRSELSSHFPSIPWIDLQR